MSSGLPQDLKATITGSTNLDNTYVNGFVDGVVREVLQPTNKNTKYEPLSYITLAKMAEFAAMFRLKVDNGSGDYVPANMFLINFQSSGGGKNRPITTLERKVFPDYISEYEKQLEMRYKGIVESIKDKEIEEGSNEKLAKSIAKDSAPNFPNRILGHSNTEQGLFAQRESLDLMGFGGSFLLISELARFIENSSSANFQMLTSFLDLFDMGDHEARAIKSQKYIKSVKGVPANGIFHTSLKSFEKKSRTSETFENIMVDMMARRSIFIYNDQIKEDKTLSLVERAKSNLKRESGVDPRFYQETIKSIIGMYRNVSNLQYKLSDEANLNLEIYRLYNLDKVENETNDVMESNLNGRYWVARKLSAVLAFFNHPEKRVVENEDLLEAIHYVEVAGNQLRSFINREKKLGGDEIFEYLLENQGVEKGKTDLRKNVYKGKQEGFYNWYRGSIEDACVIAERNGYELVTKKKHKTGVNHSLIKIEETDLSKIIMSESTSANPKISDDMEPVNYQWGEIGEVVSGVGKYSFCQYKDNKRSIENYLGKSNVIAFDVDKGISIAEIQIRLNRYNYMSLIATTKSHGKPKSGKEPCDRFRLIMPLKYIWSGTGKEYSEMIRAVASELFSPFSSNADPAPLQPAAFFFKNPNYDNYEFYYLEGDLIDVRGMGNDIYKSKADNEKLVRRAKDGILNNWQSGNRHHQSYVSACLLLNSGLSKNDVVERLVKWTSEYDNPLSKKEIKHQVESASKYKQ